jgi:carboxyl-terminal processing protease
MNRTFLEAVAALAVLVISASGRRAAAGDAPASRPRAPGAASRRAAPVRAAAQRLFCIWVGARTPLPDGERQLRQEIRRSLPDSVPAWVRVAKTSDGTTLAQVLVAGEAARAAAVRALAANERLTVGSGEMPSRAAPPPAKAKPRTKAPQESPDYQQEFARLYKLLAKAYPSFKLKSIDWEAVGREMIPKVSQVTTDAAFGLLCMQLVARLEDSHARVVAGMAEPPVPPLPRWCPGLACLIDDRGRAVVYCVRKGGPAEKAGVKVGMTVLSVNGVPAEKAMSQCMELLSAYLGYSSRRCLRYDAARSFLRQMERGSPVRLEIEDASGARRAVTLAAALGRWPVPRLPVPIAGISETAGVSWKMLPGGIGYLYVRRIGSDLIESLDAAVRELAGARALIVDVRGNSGGAFNARRAHRNFALDDGAEPDRPRFKGPIALLIDERCVSAGEGWASWFIARKRARVFGAATAGASGKQAKHFLAGGLYIVTFPVKAYRGFLDRPIERRGLEPDVPVRQSARDLAAGADTVVHAARDYLVKARIDRRAP